MAVIDRRSIVAVNVNGTDQAESIVVDQSGRIILSGSSNGLKQFAVARLTDGGALDTSFDSDGKQTVDFSADAAKTEIGYTMLLQHDGRIVLAGLSDLDVAVARLSNGGARHYVTQDANYNVTAVTDATGRVVDRYQYTAYGVFTALNADFSTDADGNGDVYAAYGFQGLRYDGNSGNWHARNRDLDPGLGRFTRNDPAGYVDGANLYEFVQSGPAGLNDPFGLDSGQRDGDPGGELGKTEIKLHRDMERVRLMMEELIEKVFAPNPPPQKELAELRRKVDDERRRIDDALEDRARREWAEKLPRPDVADRPRDVDVPKPEEPKPFQDELPGTSAVGKTPKFKRRPFTLPSTMPSTRPDRPDTAPSSSPTSHLFDPSFILDLFGFGSSSDEPCDNE